MEQTFAEIMDMYDMVMTDAPVGRPGSVLAANYLHARINEAKWWDRIGTFGQAR